MREADAVGRLAGGCDDFLDAEFGSGFDYVVGGGDVGAEAFVVGDEHVASVCCEVDDLVLEVRVGIILLFF